MKNNSAVTRAHGAALVGLVALLFLGGGSPPARAEALRLPSVIGDHMVVQQGLPITVWGWDDPGQEVQVSMAGHRRNARADDRGRFLVELPALEAGGPHEIAVDGSARKTVRDVLVGEVWVGSGQSNMHFAFSRSHTAEEETPRADQPEIHLFTAKQRETAQPADELVGRWVVATPESVQSFSAVAWHFGSTLHRELKVPVGLIVTSWPGTSGESWTPRAALLAEPALTDIVRQWDARPAGEKRALDRPFEFELEFRNVRLLPRDPTSPPLELRLRDRCTGSIPGATVTSAPSRDDAIRFSGHVEPGESGWADCPLSPGGATADLSAFVAVALEVRGSAPFTLMVDQPTVVDWDRYSSPTLATTPQWRRHRIELDTLRQAGWGVAQPFTPETLQGLLLGVTPPGWRPEVPGGLFNAMIAPLTPFGIRGFLWYQGEGNAGRPGDYRHLLPALIRGWREAWDLGDLPFLVVQLPNYRAVQEEPSDSDWARLREAQLQTIEEVPATGLAVTIDLGEADDVHPPYKREVGRRAARWALGTTYGKELEYSGPLFRKVTREGSRLRLHFQHTGSGLVARGDTDLRGFAVAGKDRRFHWARAIIEGDSVVVWSDEVPSPVAARYAWADNPVCNLYNEEGLPASPFRTDEW